MQEQEVLDIFKKSGAMLHGHFILTSGRHSAIYLQKARVFMYPQYTEQLCKALAQKIRRLFGEDIDYVVGPAIGGLIPAYETARHLQCRVIWVEREQGNFKLRRFDIEKGAKLVIIEDIVTTGLSIRETLAALREVGAEIVGAGAIIDRSGGSVAIDVPLISLCSYYIESYAPDQLPPSLACMPAVKPGSRNI